MTAASQENKRAKRVRTPTVLQMEALECGAACLGMVLCYYKKFLPLEELRVACGVSRDGSKASNILKAGRHYGLAGKGFRLEADAALKQKFPIIIFWNFNHFVVVEGVKGDTVFLNDPAMGPRTVTRQEFDEAFTGIVIVLEPGPDFKPEGKPKSLVQGLGWRLKRSKAVLSYIILASLLLIIPGILIPGFTKIFVDDYLVQGRQDWIVPLLLGMGVTLLLRLGLIWLQQKYLLLMETKLALTSSANFLWHVLRCPVEFFTQRYAGDLTQRVQANDRVATLLSGDLGTSVVNLVSIAFYVAVMALYDWLLVLIAIVFSLFNVAAVKYVQRKRKDTSMRLMQERGKVMATGMGGVQIIETLKASGAENDFFSRWSGYQAKVINSEQRLGFFNQTVSVLPVFLSGLTTAVVLGVGGFRVIEGILSIGSLVAFQTLMASFNEPITNLVEVSGKAQEINGDLARLDDVLKYARDPRFERNGTPPAVLRKSKLVGRIEVKDLTFGYSRLDAPLIEDFNLHVEPGSRVALVGSSGSGKSTLGRLIAGLYQPWSGEILFDGIPLGEISNDILATSLASVDQDAGAFDRIEPVGAIGRRRSVGPGDAHALVDDVVRALRLDPVALGVLHPEVAQRHAVAGDEQALARAPLPGEIEHACVHPCAAQSDPIGIEAEPVGQFETARLQHDLVARLGEDQRFLQAILRALARRDGDGFGKRRRSKSGQRGGGHKRADHVSLPYALHPATQSGEFKPLQVIEYPAEGAGRGRADRHLDRFGVVHAADTRQRLARISRQPALAFLGRDPFQLAQLLRGQPLGHARGHALGLFLGHARLDQRDFHAALGNDLHPPTPVEPGTHAQHREKDQPQQKTHQSSALTISSTIFFASDSSMVVWFR